MRAGTVASKPYLNPPANGNEPGDDQMNECIGDEGRNEPREETLLKRGPIDRVAKEDIASLSPPLRASQPLSPHLLMNPPRRLPQSCRHARSTRPRSNGHCNSRDVAMSALRDGNTCYLKNALNLSLAAQVVGSCASAVTKLICAQRLSNPVLHCDPARLFSEKAQSLL